MKFNAKLVISLVLHRIKTMNLNERVTAFTRLGEELKTKLESGALDPFIAKAYFENQWFTHENSRNAISAIINDFLNKSKIEKWLSGYEMPGPDSSPKNIGIVMAGNIPLAGWQDLMCVLISGNNALIKLSTKDKIFTSLFINELIAVEPRFKDKIQYAEQLKGFDAIIATGSNNTLRYFEYYFGKYPHILRKNRNSVAVLSGKESAVDFEALGKDIMAYFGLGCRNVSSLFVPTGYEFRPFFEAIEPWNIVLEHNKYYNNYNYNKSLLLLNKEPHLDNGFLLVRESAALATPVSVLNYRFYDNLEEVKTVINAEAGDIQCIAAPPGVIENSVDFGDTQRPQLWDYSDGVDVMAFLLGL
jgi:hypothetical protein